MYLRGGFCELFCTLLHSDRNLDFLSHSGTEIKKRLEIIEALQLILYFSIIGRPDAFVSLFMIAWPTPCSGKTSP